MSVSLADIARDLERLEASVKQVDSNCWCPHVPTERQLEFENLSTFEALYGGAAGGGKSDSLLRLGLRGVEVPGYNGILFRKTYRDLALPGALMDRAAEWLRPTAAEWDERDKRWLFPSGARLSFGYLESENDKYRYQSAEFQYIGLDEVTQFHKSQYLYLLSRARRVSGFPIKPFVRGGTNPGGIGHDWVKEYYLDPGHPDRPFVGARIEDNPFLDQEAYRDALSRLDSTTRAQLEFGVWVRDSHGLVYRLGNHNLIQSPPPLGPANDRDAFRVLGLDLGASESKPTTAFVSLRWIPTKETVWVMDSEVHAGMTPSDTALRIQALQDDHDYHVIVMDEGALGKGYGEEFRKRWNIPVKPAEKKNKLGYRKLLNGALEGGHVLILEPTNQELVSELRSLAWNVQGLDNEKGQPNHLTDALLYGWRACLSYWPKPEKKRIVQGTPEWYEAETRRMEAEEVRELRHEAEKPWWAR